MVARVVLVGVLVGVFVGWIGSVSAVHAGDGCVIDPVEGTIDCSFGGTEPGPSVGGATLLRYVYTAVDPVMGDCHFWSPIPGGLDAWDPANDAAIIAITTRLPVCPSTLVTPSARAWQIYRRWRLSAPRFSVTPDTKGITGLPSHISAAPPRTITHTETLPDGTVLRVRARVVELAVGWGDGTTTEHDPSAATGYPTGSVSHAYALKTCTDDYRTTSASGDLCHPFLDRYRIVATYAWVGSYNTGSGWIPLESASRSASVDYEVAEARGVNIP